MTKLELPLANDKKLTVIFRVEPGCLGPDGILHVEEFCHIAKKEIQQIHSDFVNWSVIPMHNKSLAEIEYKIGELGLSSDKAARYLEMFDKDLDEFEADISEKISILISQYLDH